MTLNPLLLHSRQGVADYSTSFVRPATADEIAGRSIDPDGFPVSKVKFANKQKKLVWIDNPIITDVTQALHTDIKKILSDNPDISGLSLLLDDKSMENLKDSVCIEDFMEPTRYVDIFDIQDFINNAKRAFDCLPVSLRKDFNNNPFELCDAINRKDNNALAKFYKFLGIEPESKSVVQEPVIKDPIPTTDVPLTGSPDSQ